MSKRVIFIFKWCWIDYVLINIRFKIIDNKTLKNKARNVTLYLMTDNYIRFLIFHRMDCFTALIKLSSQISQMILARKHVREHKLIKVEYVVLNKIQINQCCSVRDHQQYLK